MKKQKRFQMAVVTIAAATFGMSGCQSNINETVYGPPPTEQTTESITEEYTEEISTDNTDSNNDGNSENTEITTESELTSMEDNIPVAVYEPPSWFENMATAIPQALDGGLRLPKI